MGSFAPWAALTPRKAMLEAGASGPVLRQRRREKSVLYPGIEPRFSSGHYTD
jgi:hypothetical protein